MIAALILIAALVILYRAAAMNDRNKQVYKSAARHKYNKYNER